MKIGFEAKRVFHNKTGLGNYSRDLIRVLSEFFPENSYNLYNPKHSNKNKFETNNVNVFEKLPKSIFYKKFKNLWRQFGIKNDLVQDKIEIFHGLSGEIPFGLKSRNIKSVVTIHDLIFIQLPHLYSFFDRKIHFYKFQKAAKNADIIIAISQQTKKDIIQFLKVDANKIKVVYQGCNQVFKNDFTDFQLQIVKQKFDLPNDFVLNVGTIESRKNAFLIVKAIKNIQTVLVIVGKETAYSNEIKQYIFENKLENKVIFLKGLSLEELAILYKLAKIFIYPSFYEGFGIPIIEALYSKTPVITSIGGVFPEAAGPNSIFVNPESVIEMENAISKLLNDDLLRKEMSEKGFDFAQQFNDENIANEYMNIYKSLL